MAQKFRELKMGKRKHNAKGRQVKDVIVDDSETKKVNQVYTLNSKFRFARLQS